MKEEVKDIYIKSIEGVDIYNHMYRGGWITNKYLGMYPYSLESRHLQQLQFKKRKLKINKYVTDDIINVKFSNNKYIIKRKILIKSLDKKIENEKDEQNKKELKKQLNILSNATDADDKSYNATKMRELLYTEGFTINNIKYVVYKRSVSKSRTGQVLFIKEDLYQKMIDWCNMGLRFNKECDYVSLLAYQSLTGSAIKDIIEINPNNIFIIDDIDSVFTQQINVVRNINNSLTSTSEKGKVKNSLFDGQGLLESSYFKDNKGFYLLRNHFTKCAVFNTNIQMFLKDNCPIDNYNEWVLHSDISGDIYAKDIHMITTPNSLKFLKLCTDANKTKSQMFNYWKKKITKDNCVWGICKSEHATPFDDYFDDDEIINQTSYQMLNCIKFTEAEVDELLQYEYKLIDGLKNDINILKQYLTDTADDNFNCNNMWVQLLNLNPQLQFTRQFNNYKAKKVSDYKKRLVKGKIKLNGDYCTLFGNPLEMLYSAISVDVLSDDYNLQMKGNTISTTLHPYNNDYVCFRNPNTSPANVLLSHNIHVPDINKYFNLTANIVCVNAIKFPIQDILSGCDYDSDTAIIFNYPTLTRVVKERVWEKYNVTINDIKYETQTYLPNQQQMAIIDNKLAKSQEEIGQIVNLGQKVMSYYYHTGNEKLYEKVDIATILSCVAIDNAKRPYKVIMSKAIGQLRKDLKNKFPKFMKNIKKIDEDKLESLNCTMDIIVDKIEALPEAEAVKNQFDLKLALDINKYVGKDVDNKQAKNIINLVKNLTIRSYDDNAKNIEEINRENFERRMEFYRHISKLKINSNTMCFILQDTVHAELLKALYLNNKDDFLSIWQKNIDKKDIKNSENKQKLPTSFSKGA